MPKTSPTMIAGVIAAAAIAAGGWWLAQPAPSSSSFSLAAAAQEAGASTEELLPDIILGAETAPVTLIEYASYTCPHCARWHEEVFGPLKADYIDTGKVRFIHREIYFDRFGLLAATVANCAGPEKYYPISGLIYETQHDWIGDGTDSTVAANLTKLGLKAGLTQEALSACMTDVEHAQAMVATFQTRATNDNVESTPTLLVNGVKYSNMSYDELKKILDAAANQG
jgi:protein-disulfide isomerase